MEDIINRDTAEETKKPIIDEIIEDDFHRMTEFSALYRAHQKAKRGKKNKREVMEFELNLGLNLMKVQDELRSGTYAIDGYRKFLVYEPREREIQTLSYRDRMIQHAICDEVLIPQISKKLIYDNVACQEEKGNNFAVKRLTAHLVKFYKEHGNKGYFLKADIKSYFASIDHDIIKKLIAKEFTDEKIRSMIDMYIDSYANENGTGLAQGNLVSQVLALYYLNPLDHFIKEELRVKYYIRYMDDMVLVHEDKEKLKEIRFRLESFIEHKLHLRFNEKTEMAALSQGIDFIGFHFYVTESGKVIRRLRKSAKKRLQRKFNKMKYDYYCGRTDLETINKQIVSIQGHLKQGHTYQLQKKIFQNFTIENLEKGKQHTIKKIEERKRKQKARQQAQKQTKRTPLDNSKRNDAPHKTA